VAIFIAEVDDFNLALINPERHAPVFVVWAIEITPNLRPKSKPNKTH
jgi:hypothetical protein